MRNFLVKLKNLFTKYKKPILHSLMFIGFVIALVFIFVLIINLNIINKTNNKIYSINEINEAPQDYDCILILGAGVREDDSPTPMLRDRLLTGIEAHFNKPNIPILLSGDSENPTYTETTTMQNFLINNGIDKSTIICDGYGLSTYESIWRAKNVYNFNKILIISQKYHLHRAIYIAEKLGIEAYGIDAALTSYKKQYKYSLREYLARLKDVFYAEIQPKPQYTDIWRDINE